MRELFVYYRVRPGEEAAALQVVTTFQSQLRQRFEGLEARLLCRFEPSTNPQTWMETYAMDPRQGSAGITAEMQQDIETQAFPLAPFLAGARHAEVFNACVSRL